MIVQKEERIKTKFGLIPTDWRIKRLKELGSSIIGLTYSPKDMVDKNEGILVLRSSNIKNGRLSFKDNVYIDMDIKEKLYVKKGDLLICARNGSKQLIGKNAYIDKDYNYSFGAFMSVFRSEYNEYIYQLFQTDMYKKQIQANLGATINQITTRDINSFQFPFPKNIKEQQKIASILSTWDKAIELKEKLIELKKEQKKGLMQKLLTGEVRLPGFEGEWKEISLNKFIQEYKEKSTIPNQFPILTSSRNGLMLQSEYYSNHQVTKNDNVGYNIIPRGFITYRSRSDDGKFVFNKNTMIDHGIVSYFYPVFKFDDKVCEDFILELLNYTIERQASSFVEGTAQKVLSIKKLGSFKYLIPTIEEQKAIATRLILASKEIRLLESEVATLKKQKQGLMQLLLTGKVRVKV
ncbi:restriction endonuclease subunit S [Shouchella clausii]|nr:restriction endonuclease subunit S [Shouchella clausii]